MFALAVVPFILVAPAHADSINLSFDTSNATLRGSGKYLRYRNVITVDNSNSYGFTLSMYANNPDLVNSSDSNYVINSVSGRNRYLGANQWGYSMTGDSGTFNEIPNSSYNAATLADVTNDAKGVCDRVSYCGIPITFGANIEPKKSASGYYSTTLTYTATSKPAPYVPPAPTPPAPAPYVPPEPPKPQWTTNGCYYSGGDWHNCYVFYNSVVLGGVNYGYNVAVIWKDNAWYRIDTTNQKEHENWFRYNDYSTTWAHVAILTKSGDNKSQRSMRDSRATEVKLDPDDIVKIFAFVPAYSRQGNYINFCRSTSYSNCKYSDASDSFNNIYHRDEFGFWVGLRAMGCTNVPDESKCGGKSYRGDCSRCDALVGPYYNNDKIAEAKKVANTLAEALGSPCY